MNCTVKSVHLLGLHTRDKGWITLLEVPLSRGLLQLWSWGVIISPPLVNTSESRKVHICLHVIRCRMQEAGCRMLLVWLLWLLHRDKKTSPWHFPLVLWEFRRLVFCFFQWPSQNQETRGMTQWLRALATLAENLNSVLSTHVAAHNCL